MRYAASFPVQKLALSCAIHVAIRAARAEGDPETERELQAILMDLEGRLQQAA